jgi:hypothetical protein
MSKTDSVLSVYSDARSEYTKQLCIYLVPAYFQFFLNLLEKAKQISVNEPKRVLWHFQNLLNEIHDWNMEKVNNEINQINNNSGCDYLEDLLTAVFIAHTKVLTAIRLSSNKKKIQITVPKVEHFLFKVLCECSKLLWSSTYLFRDGISSVEKQQNYRTIEQQLTEGIHQAIRSLVPVKSILKDFMNIENNDNSDSDSDSDEEDNDREKNEQVKENIADHLNSSDGSIINKVDEIGSVINDKTTNEVVHLGEATETNEAVQTSDAIQASEEANNMINNEVQENAMQLHGLGDLGDSNSVIDSSSVIDSNSVIDMSKESAISDGHEHVPTIIIEEEEKSGVRFGDYNTVFQSGNPEGSDMIEAVDNSEENETPDIEILDEVGTLLDDNDFESLDDKNSDTLDSSDYDVLN